MASIKDFRLYSEFTQPRVRQSGRSVGNRIYWKLYAIENFLRVIINSILSVGYSQPEWWNYVLSPNKLKDVDYRRNQHVNLTWNSTRGKHVLYYLNLVDLGEIIRTTQPYLIPLISELEIDNLILAIASINQPRNVVAHMSFPTEDDQKRINELYTQATSLIRRLEKESKIELKVPK
jgi:hypothetical protein